MRIASLIALIILFPTFAHAAVVINEIAWMGTAVSANAEWMELANTGNSPIDLTGWHLAAGNGSPAITLAGSIASGGYFLLERSSDASVPNVTADQIYTGALTNSGTTLTLSDAGGNTIDQVTGGANWSNVGGDNANKETAQRTASGWETAAATPRAINAGVSNSSSSSTTPDTSSATSTEIAVNPTSHSGGLAEYVPIPALRIVTSGDRAVSSGADTAFTAVVYDNKGNKRDDAIVTYAFGDGMRKVGASVFHAYYDPGEYLAVVHASTPDGGDALSEIVVTVKDANIQIASVSSRGISLANNGSRTLDVSLWRLSAGGQEFKIPADTQILAGRTILFPSQVIELPVADSAFLLYPSGEVAAAYPRPVSLSQTDAILQPSPAAVSYEQVQKVEKITSTKPNIQTHEEAVDAPAAATEVAAAGAALNPESTTPVSRPTGIFKSPWTLGLLGVIIAAGGAFILL